MDQKEIKNIAEQLADRKFKREYEYLGRRIYGLSIEECHGRQEIWELKPKYQKIYEDMYDDFLKRLNNRYGV